MDYIIAARKNVEKHVFHLKTENEKRLINHALVNACALKAIIFKNIIKSMALKITSLFTRTKKMWGGYKWGVCFVIKKKMKKQTKSK